MLYCWNTKTGEKNANWPGVKTEYINRNFWKGSISLIGATHVIFSNGYEGIGNQSRELTPVDRHLYDYDSDLGIYEDSALVSTVEELMLNVC